MFVSDTHHPDLLDFIIHRGHIFYLRIYKIYIFPYLHHSHSSPDPFNLGFLANETFREKMQTYSRNFAFFRENKLSKISRKAISRKCENFVKTMSVIAATINCSKELLEFSALIPQYLKFYYVILIISLPLL